MSVAPIEFDDEVQDFPLTDEQYARALDGQQRSAGRHRRLRLVRGYGRGAERKTNVPADVVEVAVSSIEQATQSALMTKLALRLLERELGDVDGRATVRAVLSDIWPWTSHLPMSEFAGMLDELSAVLRSQPPCPERDAAATQLLIEWEHTAEVWADPELLDRLTADGGGDFGAVPIPEGEDGESGGQ